VSDDRSRRARSFGAVADLYDRTRPDYPDDAVEWALAPVGAPTSVRVADLGAGTGIMTRRLLTLGYTPVPVEPDPKMRARLEASTPGVSAHAGSAEELPLPDGSLDAAVAAQSYHWFDHDRAHREIARVVRSGGVFAAIWNIRDESEPWVHQLSEILGEERASDSAERIDPISASFGDGFGPIERGIFHHSESYTPDTLVALLQSRSYFITASPQHQNELIERVRELAMTHPDLAGRDRFALPYRTEVYRAVRSV
jgi:SAM-dependent methyltransferase